MGEVKNFNQSTDSKAGLIDQKGVYDGEINLKLSPQITYYKHYI